MHQEQPMTYFLFRYESTSGLWVQTKLDSPVSLPLQEAMNTILLKDGTLAFIGTKSEFGRYEIELKNRREVDSTGYWTSLPEATILATLGLCLNPSTAEGRSLVFHGSPRALMLAVLIDYARHRLLRLPIQQMEMAILKGGNFRIRLDELKAIKAVGDGISITANEQQDSLSDLVAWCLFTKSQRGLFKRVNESSIMELDNMLDRLDD